VCVYVCVRTAIDAVKSYIHVHDEMMWKLCNLGGRTDNLSLV